MGVNLYKVRHVLDFIRHQGPLPKDQYDQILTPHDMVAWFRLKDCLSPEEVSYIETELEGVIAAERAVEQLRRSYEGQSGMS